MTDQEHRAPVSQELVEVQVPFDDLIFYVASLLAQVKSLGINIMQPLEEAEQRKFLQVFNESDVGLLAELDRVIALGLTQNIENAFYNRYGIIVSFSVGVLLKIYEKSITLR